jgi:LacI family transcriptional regulator
VEVDLRPGTTALMKHLAGLGHREVVWFGDDEYLAKRYEMANKCAETAGMVCRDARVSISASDGGGSYLDRIIRGARDAFAGWLAENEPPTAVVAANEKVAFGVCRALHREGLRVPQDVSVAGYDDIRAVLCDPPLTVVSQALTEMGEAAARLALEMTENPGKTRQLLQTTTPVASSLVVRESTAAPRNEQTDVGGTP